MRKQPHLIQIKRTHITYLIVMVAALAAATPALADYLGPNRTVTETHSSCKIILNECKYVPDKGDYRYHKVDDWSCSNESKPWLSYPSEPPRECTSLAIGEKYWERDEVLYESTITYPPATISGTLQNCTLNNGWCIGAPQLSLIGSEPVSGYSILAIEGTRNGQGFACSGANCKVSLLEGHNNFTFWAFSSFADTSTMGSLNAKVDSQKPTITGTLSGTPGSNGWYTSPITFNSSASDSTSGLAAFTCTLDGIALGSCGSVTIDSEGLHTLSVTARDNAGHTRTFAQSVSIDLQNPLLDASLSGLLGSNNWYNAAVLNGSALDPGPGSGLSTFEYSLDDGSWSIFPPSGVLFLPESRHTVNLRAMDHAGRTITSSKSFSLDSSLPAITLDPVGTVGMENWYTGNLYLSALASDEVSGMDIFEYSFDHSTWLPYITSLVLEDGTHTVWFWAQDQAGLVTQIDRTYKVDTRSPQIAGSLNGTQGKNGWFISQVTVSASASDPMSGSGMDAFNYILDDDPPAVYTDSLTLADGQHTLQFTARDKAGLFHSTEASVKVDTLPPSLEVETDLPGWVRGSLELDGTAGDSGSGLSKVEISTDGGQSWQTVETAAAWSHVWNTQTSPNGLHDVLVRASDNAGLLTTQTLRTGVDNHAPRIGLPDSWYQWDTVTLNISDDHSGLAEARLEISDPEGRWPARIIRFDPQEFPIQFKWDRRFGDDTVAPLGSYNVKVIAFDKLGNLAHESAAIKILLGVLPAGPTATPQSTARPELTSTPVYTATSTPFVTPTQAVVVTTFGSTVEPEIPGTSTSPVSPTPRATPTQTGVLEWLQSIFMPDSKEITIEIGSLGEAETSSTQEGNVLWGAAAAAMMGSVTAYALEEKRRQQEEKARQRAQEAEEEERREKKQAQKMEKLEAQWAQERAWEEARLEQELLQRQQRDALNLHRLGAITNGRKLEAEEEARWIASQTAIRERYEEKLRAEQEKKKAEDLQAGLEAYYNARKLGETTASSPVKEKSWFEKGLDWIDEHQTEIALGIGVAVGVGAILASGGLATPLVAAAWMAGAATVAAGTVAVGTIALNLHYERDWNEKLLKNVAVAGITAVAVTGAGFLFSAATVKATAFCTVNPATCALATPVFKIMDTVEETWINAKLTYQLANGDQAGASETALELHSEYADGGVPGNFVLKELRDQLKDLNENAIKLIRKHGVDTIPLLIKYGDDALEIIQKYGDDGIALLLKHGDAVIKFADEYGITSLKLLQAFDDDVLDYAVGQGPDAVAALSGWSTNDLREHGVELALRAQKDAKVLADVKKLITSGPIDPKNLTEEQKELIRAIAENSTQYADEGQVVLGKWVDISSGFVERAQDTGSAHYNPHPDMWNMLGDLGGQNQNEVAWLINQQVVQTGLNKGLPFEYTLNGIPEKNVYSESSAVEAIFAGAADDELMETLGLEYLPIRMKELQELHKAGYKYSFDEINNSYILSLP